jgi:beta-barrel assembly-enhancing protease
MKSIKISLVLMGTLLLFQGCKKGAVLDTLFPVSRDIALGQQLSDHIKTTPAEYPLVDSAKNHELYAYMYQFRNIILNSGKVKHKNDFAWNIKIIDEPTVQNAFAAPGGYIYIYTGIINYLDSAQHFAGVLGHEIAHADRRHSVNQMIENTGVQVLLDIALGNNNGIAQIAQSLAGLKFSRKDEADADAYSVQYLCGTPYEANGTAGFFAKLVATGQAGNTPQFLSTHPNPKNRVSNINKQAAELSCNKNGEKINWTKVKALAANIKK